LIGDELVKIGVCEHATPTALAVAKGDVFQRARGDVAVEGLDGAAQLACGLGRRAQAIGWRDNLSACADAEQIFNSLTQGSRGLRLQGEPCLEPPRQAVDPNEDARAFARDYFYDIGWMGHVAPGMALHRSSLDPLFDSGGSGRFI
jgi:hypothetical protein